MAAGPFAALGEPSCDHFFSILQCKMEKKWAAPGAPFLAAKITAHFFSILQCKMEKKWLQDPSRPWANRPAATFFTILHGKREKKWAAPGAPFLAGKITAHFFSILQCKMEKNGCRTLRGLGRTVLRPFFHHFTVQNGGKMAVGRPEQNEPKMGPK